MLIYIDAENSPVLQNESAGGANVVLAEPTDVIIKQSIATMYSFVHKSLTVTQPQGKDSPLATIFPDFFFWLTS